MDLQRSLLIGAIAVLSFMLLTEWVAFKDARTATAAQETSRLINTAGEPPTPMIEPDTGDAAAVEEDLPTAPEMAVQATETPTTPAANSGRIIQVYTDVLQLAIDLKGGDIIELSLPKHLERQDNPDSPFVLLEQNEQLVYIAQSGLILSLIHI